MRIAWFAAATVLCGGCVWELGEELAGRSRLGEVVGDCVVPMPAELEAWGAPVSVEYPDRSLWIWVEATAADGSALRNVGAFVSSVEAACRGEMSFVFDADGAPLPLVSLTAEEEALDAARTDGRRTQLALTGGFVHGGAGYGYYEKIVAGPGLFDAVTIGTGLCRMAAAGEPCERATPGVVPDEPTLLWSRGGRPLDRGAFLASDGYAYVWGCLHAAAFLDPCSVARVSPGEAGDPAAYEYAGWDGEWIADGWNAGAVFEDPGALTPGYNAYLGRYTAVTVDIWNSAIELRRSEAPGGGYDDPVRLFDAVPPEEWFIGGGIEHAALAEEGGRTIAVSYFTNAAGPKRGLHLVTFRFAEGG
ncbi:MAG: hypothetical protein HY905_26355 [Deltaproteobacteria bacterium]|nr:hypothetical protein [Deltaproteobacteria bacterium]